MTKNYLFLLLGLLLAACSSDDKDEQPILVTNVVMPASGTVFKLGEKVTIMAKGFQDNDEIMFDIRWPLQDEVLHEGYAKGGRGVITEKTATSITFLAPGHWPASTTEILLCRSGQMMSLGKISVADGQAPKDFQLYGIINSRSNTDRPYAIEYINLEKPQTVEIVRLADNQDFSCVVNLPGSWSLSGVWTQDNRRTTGLYDLSMNYWEKTGADQLVTMGIATGNSVFGVYQGGDRLFVKTVNVMPYTRMYIPEKPDYGFLLPEGMKAEVLSRYPCIQMSDGNILCSADNGDGTFSPVVLNGQNMEEKSIYVGEPIQAVALIPFWIVKPVEGMGTAKYTRVGGYIVSKRNGATAEEGDGTEFRLWNPATKTLDEPFTTFSNAACSVATLVSEDFKKQELYVLFDGSRNGRLIYVYDLLKGSWESLYPGGGFPYSEIVLAR